MSVARRRLKLPMSNWGAGSGTRRGSDYAALSRLIRQDGLLKRRPGYYATKISIMTVLYLAGWAGASGRAARPGASCWWRCTWRRCSASSASSGTKPGTGRSSGSGGPTTSPGWCSATC